MDRPSCEATDMIITSVSTDEGLLAPHGLAEINVQEVSAST